MKSIHLLYIKPLVYGFIPEFDIKLNSDQKVFTCNASSSIVSRFVMVFTKSLTIKALYSFCFDIIQEFEGGLCAFSSPYFSSYVLMGIALRPLALMS